MVLKVLLQVLIQFQLQAVVVVVLTMVKMLLLVVLEVVAGMAVMVLLEQQMKVTQVEMVVVQGFVNSFIRFLTFSILAP